MSKVSDEIERIAKELRGKPDPLMLPSIADRLEELAEPQGGVGLGHVCDECGVLLEDDEVGDLDECPNCGATFWEL
jgi:rubrerythrin